MKDLDLSILDAALASLVARSNTTDTERSLATIRGFTLRIKAKNRGHLAQLVKSANSGGAPALSELATLLAREPRAPLGELAKKASAMALAEHEEHGMTHVGPTPLGDLVNGAIVFGYGFSFVRITKDSVEVGLNAGSRDDVLYYTPDQWPQADGNWIYCETLSERVWGLQQRARSSMSARL